MNTVNKAFKFHLVEKGELKVIICQSNLHRWALKQSLLSNSELFSVGFDFKVWDTIRTFVIENSFGIVVQ